MAYTFTFDYENRITEVKQGTTGIATFVYDADGNRVKGTVSGVTTVYVAGVYEYQGGATTKYYEGNAMRRTSYASGNGVQYLLRDHLGSSSVIIKQDGTVAKNDYYYPYGGNRGTAFSTLTTKRFTGQYHESGLPGGEGLSYYNARWYDAQLGRFVSADTLVPELGNPQDLNRMAYVRGNPLRFVDPSGHALCIDANCNTLHHPVGGNKIIRSPGPYRSARNNRFRSNTNCVSIVCLPTSTPTPTRIPFLPLSMPTPIPMLLPGPTYTPTPYAMLTPGEPLPPTPTPVPDGSVNISSIYWSLSTYTAREAFEEMGVNTTIRAAGRAGVMFGPAALIGYGVSVAPNVVDNFSSGNGFSSPELYADLATDSLGFVVSSSASALGAFGGTLIAGPGAGTVVGGVGGAAISSAIYDITFAPKISSNINDWLRGTGLFGP